MPALLVILLVGQFSLPAEDFDSLCADRTAIEQIYYQHRLGAKPPFAQVSPPALIQRLVRADLKQEAVLKQVYGVEIAGAPLAAEVNRINSTTRAPDVLAEIKAALGNDPQRFAEAFAKPFLVNRELRERFANDDALHASARNAADQARRDLLAARTNGASPADLHARLKRNYSNAVSEIIWQLGARPASPPPAPTADELEVKKRFGPNAQIISAPENDTRQMTHYFEELPGGLQKVLRAQLHEAGDVSAVIETPGGFLVYLAQARTSNTLSVAVLSIAKRNFDQWLAGQSDTAGN
jgi:hypothetical protein